MGVSSTAGYSWVSAQYAYQTNNASNTKSTTKNQTDQSQSAQSQIGDAASVNLSAAGKLLNQQTTTEQTIEGFSVDNEGANETKGLTDEQYKALEEDYLASQQNLFNVMIKVMTENNDKLQGWLDDGVGFLNFDGTKIEAARFALPEVATNPEDAAKAIAPGGEWSVDAVSSRIFDLATALAGNDPEKLSQMRAAVEEGFKQAGLTWKDATGQDKMPEITNQTYNEIMSRFDKRANELNGASLDQ